MIVLDASAVLALLHDEPGGDMVAARLPGSHLSTANLAEIIGKVIDAGLEGRRLRGLLAAAGVVVEPLTAEDAELAGALRELPGGRSLSLGDRCCLALGLREDAGEVVTADRAWSHLDLPITITLIR